MDREVSELIKKEEERQKESLCLIASENYTSQAVRDAVASVFSHKYAEGYPGKRYYPGNIYGDELEQLVYERALKLFGLSADEWHINTQALSGSPANFTAYAALVPFGETISGLQLDMGGHLTHGHTASFTSKFWRSAPYVLNAQTHLLDYDMLRDHFRSVKPKIIIAGFTAYSRIPDFQKFRELADEVGAYLLVDMAHVAGLIAGGVHPSPFPYADIVTTTTHKTLRGPRGALIFANRKSQIAKNNNIDIASKIDKAVFPGMHGGPHLNIIAGIAVCLYEAAQPAFRDYAKNIVANAQNLAAELAARGFSIITGGTDTHLFLVDVLGAAGKGGKEAQNLLEQAHILANMNTIPYDTRKPFDPSGLRIGTPSITTRGAKEQDMPRIAAWIADVLKGKQTPEVVKKEVKAFMEGL
ncbi:MAG: serine hydroxymethyltransferase [Patescibacteria group bacterium]